jgi:hypothetical protein
VSETCRTEDQVCSDAQCIAPCGDPANAHNYLGCDFWSATLDNPLLRPLTGFPFAVAIANPNAYAITVRVDGGALTQLLSQPVAPGAIATMTLPWVDAAVTPRTASALAEHAAYHIHTNGPIIAYEFNPLTYRATTGDPSFTNDASLLLPVRALTAHYTFVGYEAGQIAIVAVDANPTEVTIRASDAIGPGEGVAAGTAGETRTVTLHQGDVLQLGTHEFPPTDETGNGDLTGTTITASSPIAVFSGHPCARIVPAGGDPMVTWTCDHLEDQLLPNEAWGHRYAVTAFADRPTVPSRIRVVALHDHTQLTFDPPQDGVQSALDAHEHVDLEIPGDVVVSANEPILVAQFMVSAHGTTPPESLGDPSLVFESPTEQYRGDSVVLTPSTYTRNYLAIVGPADMPPLFDGSPITSAPRAIGTSGLAVWAFETRPGTHRIRGTAPDARYGVKVYGIAPYTSYAYPGGLDLDPISPPG